MTVIHFSGAIDLNEFIEKIECSVIKINPEATHIFPEYRKYDNVFQAKNLTGMLDEAIDGYEYDQISPQLSIVGGKNAWANDLSSLVRTAKLHGVIEEAEGLADKYIKIKNKHIKIENELTELSDKFAQLKEENEKLTKRNEDLEIENSKIKLQIENK